MNFLGLDIAKLKVDVHLISSETQKPRHRVFQNQVSGFAELHHWLSQQGLSPATVHSCMEATGIYHEAIAAYLVEQGYLVSVVNPCRIKSFARSQLSRHKTDKRDAQTIALFCQTQQPPIWQPLSAEERTLQALVRHRDALMDTRQQQRNRLESARVPEVATSLQWLIVQLDEELARLEAQIYDHTAHHDQLHHQTKLLTSIVGIGENTAVHILAEIPDLASYPSAKAVAAEAGLTPMQRTSGSSVRGKTRLSKIGNPRLRKILYLPALAAIRFNVAIRAWYLRLLERGKSKMAAVGAVMRKLLHIAYGVLKNNTPFDPNWGQP